MPWAISTDADNLIAESDAGDSNFSEILENMIAAGYSEVAQIFPGCYSIAGKNLQLLVNSSATPISSPPVTGLVLHLEADSVVADGSNNVTAWPDQSGQGNDLEPVGNPQLVPAGLNGQPTINLSSGSYLRRLSNVTGLPSGASDRTVFFLVNYQEEGRAGFSYGFPGINNVFGVIISPNGNLSIQGWGSSNDRNTNFDALSQSWLLQEVVLETNFLSHYSDGILIDAGAQTYNTVLDRIAVGSEIDGDPTRQMQVAAILVYDYALTNAEIQAVESYLYQKYFPSPAPTAYLDCSLSFSNGARLRLGDSVNVIATGENKRNYFIAHPNIDFFLTNLSLGSRFTQGVGIENPLVTPANFISRNLAITFRLENEKQNSGGFLIFGNNGLSTGSHENLRISSNDIVENTSLIAGIADADYSGLFIQNIPSVEFTSLTNRSLQNPVFEAVKELRVFAGDATLENGTLIDVESISPTGARRLNLIQTTPPAGKITASTGATPSGIDLISGSSVWVYNRLSGNFLNSGANPSSFILIPPTYNAAYIKTLDAEGSFGGGNILGEENLNNRDRIVAVVQKVSHDGSTTISEQNSGSWQWVCVEYGKRLASGTITLEGAKENQDTINITFLDDVTVADFATASSYTGINFSATAINNVVVTVSENHSKQALYDYLQTVKSSSSASGVTLGNIDLPLAFLPDYDQKTYDIESGEVQAAFVLNAQLTGSQSFVVDAFSLTLGNGVDFSGLEASILSGATIVVSGNQNLSSVAFNGGAIIDNASANPVTITVASGEAAKITTSSSGGGAIAIQEPTQSTAISGLPTANNSNGVAPNPVLGFYDNADGSWLGGLSTASPEYNGDGSFSVALTDYLATGTIAIVGDAVGWLRTAKLLIAVSNAPSTISLEAAFVEILNETGTAIVGQGTADAIARFSYDQANQRFEVAPGGLDFYSAVDAAEALSSNLSGLQAFDTDVIRGVRFIENKYGKEIQIPSPLTVAATEDAATSPVLTDFLVLRTGNPNEDLFDHGLTSTASGLTDRPEVRLTSTRFVSGSESGALSPTQETQLADAATRLVDLTEDDGGVYRLTANALEQAPSGGGGGSGDATAANQASIINALTAIQGTTFDTATDSLEALRNQGDAAWTTATGFLDATGVRSAIGLSSANLDNQLADLPTVTEFEARTLLSSAYFDPTETTVDVGAIAGNAVTNISDFHADLAATNTAIAAIPTNPLLATGYIAPDNAGIVDAVTAAQSADGKLTTTRLGYIDSLVDPSNFQADISGLSTLSSNDVQTAATAALTVYDSPTRAEATTDKAEVLAAISPIPTNPLLATAYTAPDNAGIAAAVTAAQSADTRLSNPNDFKADVSGLSTLNTSDVQAAATAALTSYDPPTRTELTSDKNEILSTIAPIPTNPLLTNDARLNNLNAPIGSIPTTLVDVEAALTSYDAARVSDVQVAVNGGFTTSDRNTLAQISSDASIARKGVTNRSFIDQTNNTGTLFDDDQTTTLVIKDLKDANGNPSNERVYESVPR